MEELRMTSHNMRAILVLPLTLIAGGCSTTPTSTEIPGACAEVFSAQVCTWAKTSGTELVEIGATIPLSAIENAPADAPMQWPPAPVATIDLPAAVRERAGLTQLVV